MNATIDAGIKSCLEDISALSSYDVFCGISEADLPEKGSYIIVATQTADHAAGGFFRATVQVQVVTEALHAATATDHNTVCGVISDYFLGAGLADDWSDTDLSYQGHHLASTQQQIESSRFTWVAELILGVKV